MLPFVLRYAQLFLETLLNSYLDSTKCACVSVVSGNFLANFSTNGRGLTSLLME
jgi:hypothetical protein